MPLTRPNRGDPVVVEDFGQPVYDYIVANIPTAWTSLPYASGWSNFGQGYTPGQYRKIGDIVYVRGLATPSNVNFPGGFVFTLPAGFRPPTNGAIQYVFLYYNGTGQVPIACNMEPTGTFNILGPLTNCSAFGLNFSFSTIA